jgi:hypothetical protein
MTKPVVDPENMPFFGDLGCDHHCACWTAVLEELKQVHARNREMCRENAEKDEVIAEQDDLIVRLRRRIAHLEAELVQFRRCRS